MGSSHWEYVVTYRGSVSATLTELHREIFEQEYGPGTAYATLDALWADGEFMGNTGTHSILDIEQVVDTSEPPRRRLEDYGTVRPLAPDRILHWFDTLTPTREQYESLRDQQKREFKALYGDEYLNRPKTLDDEASMRWAGRYLLLYTGDQPTHVAFWGHSGD